jgi:hypothetical protein
MPLPPPGTIIIIIIIIIMPVITGKALRSVRMTDSCLQTVLRHKHLAGPVEGFV